MITEEEIRKNIIKKRTELRLTQGYMASKMNLKQAGYSLIESGQRKMSLANLLQIAIALDVDITELITSDKKEKPKESVKATLQIELQQEKKDQVLKLVFGDNNLEILNK